VTGKQPTAFVLIGLSNYRGVLVPGSIKKYACPFLLKIRLSFSAVLTFSAFFLLVPGSIKKYACPFLLNRSPL
jgi:hypothetical protein